MTGPIMESLADHTHADYRTGEMLFRRMLEKLPVGAYTCDDTGRITFFNESAVSLWGRAPRLHDETDRYCGSFKLFSSKGEPIQHDRCWMALALKTGKEYNGREIIIERPGGERITALAHANPIFNEMGKLTGAVNVLVDIDEHKQAEEVIRASEERFRLLTETIPSILWTADADGNVTYINSRGDYRDGLDSTQQGQAWGLHIHEDDRARCMAAWAQAVKSGKEFIVESRKRCKDGVYRWFVSRAVPLHNAKGEISQWFGATTEINEQKRAEERARFLADASAALSELTDENSTLQRLASIAVPEFADWCAIYTLDANDVPRRSALAYRDSKNTAAARALEHCFMRMRVPCGPRRVLSSGLAEWIGDVASALDTKPVDEEYIPLVRELGLRSYIGVPVRSHRKILGVLIFMTAESGRAYTPNDLTAAEDLASRVAISLENAALVEALKEADKRKDEFLALLAHELRNPLAPIRNAVEILFAEDPTPTRTRWARGLIDRQVQQLTRLVDDLLDVSRITRDKIELRKERIALDTVVTSAIEACRPLIDSLGHRLSVELPQEIVFLEADSTRLAQIMLNLLNNAAKYTPQGGHISLHVEREDLNVRISIRDNGIGMTPETLPNIFDIFYQADRALDRAKGGLGIGLTLVRKLVDLHGGTISAKSEGEGLGCVFTITLPLSFAPQTNDGIFDRLKGQTNSPYRVLIVDDNKDAAESLEILFTLWGHEVHTAYDGISAVERAVGLHPDIILLDIGLPRLNGYDVARAIRRKLGEEIVLIAVTGWGQEEDRKNSKSAGFDVHLTKPLEFNHLQDLLNEIRLTRESKAASVGYERKLR